MKFKGSVPVTSTLHPAILFALEVADRVFRAKGVQLVITGCQEEGHSEKSLHYGVPGDVRCRAVDLRVKGIVAELVPVLETELRKRLSVLEFDIINEGDHLHLEYDAKA